MARQTNNLLKIIQSAEGKVKHLSIDGEGKRTDKLVEVIQAANKTRLQLTIRNLTHLRTDSVLKLLSVCGPNINLEI